MGGSLAQEDDENRIHIFVYASEKLKAMEQNCTANDTVLLLLVHGNQPTF